MVATGSAGPAHTAIRSVPRGISRGAALGRSIRQDAAAGAQHGDTREALELKRWTGIEAAVTACVRHCQNGNFARRDHPVARRCTRAGQMRSS